MGFVASFVIALVMMVVGELLRPKQSPPNAKAASIDDFDFPTATENRNWTWLAGKCLVEGANVTWFGDLAATPIKKKVKTGLWSSKNVTIAHKYYLGVEMFLTVGEANVTEIRFGGDAPNIYTRTETADTIVFNFNDPNFFGGQEKDGGIVGVIRINKGTQTQSANAYLQTAIGRPRSAYKGLCFAALEKLYVGTRENIRPISFVVERYPNSLGMTLGKERIGDDSNPACMIYELLTNRRWAAAIPTTEIDAVNFRSIGDKLHAEGMGLSMIINSARSAQDAVAEILRHIDGVMYTDTETGLLTLALARDDYDVATLQEYGPRDISSFNFSRGSWATTKNTLMVSFIDRDQDFTPRSFPLRENGNIHVRNGEIAPEEIDYLGFSKAENALKRGMVTLKMMSYPLMSAKIVMNGRGWKLRPGSVFKLNWPVEGIEGAVMRVVRINYGDIVRNRIELDCIEDIFAIASNAYVVPPPSQWVNPVGPPQPLSAQFGFEVPYHMLGQEGRYAAVMGARFSGIDEGFEMWHDPNGGSNYSLTERTTEFTATAVLAAEYPANTPATHAAGFTVSSARDFDQLSSVSDAELLAGDSLLLIKSAAGEEWMAWKSVTNNGDGTYSIGTVVRGVFDTVPLTHPAGSRVWFVSSGVELLSDIPYGANGNVSAKLLPYNTRGILPIASAAALTIGLTQRAMKPYPPAKILVDGSAVDDTVSGNATVTWSIRHRVQQHLAGVVVAQDAANFVSTPEGNFEVKVYIDGAVRRTTLISATPFDTFEYTPAMRVADYADVQKTVRFGIRAINGAYSSAERLSHDVFLIDALNPLTITTTTLPDAEQGIAYSQQLNATGGATPYTWTKIAGTWPAGLSMSSSGLISGTPTNEQESQTVTVQVEGPAGVTDTQVLAVQVSGDCAGYTIPAATGATFNLADVEEVMPATGNEVHICNVVTNSPNPNVVSLLHFNGADASNTFTDETGKVWTAFGQAQHDTAQSKFGGSSGLFDGVLDHIKTPNHADWDFGSGDFTVEAWLRFNSVAKNENQGIVCHDEVGGTRGWLMYTNDSGTAPAKAVGFGAWIGGSASTVTDTVAVATGVWTHWAAVRDGNVLRLYKNGVQVSTAAIIGSVGNPNKELLVGNLMFVAGVTNSNLGFDGHMDELRVIKGDCIYPNGTTFTPPTLPFPNP